jgi:hypothetical protein
MLAQHPFRISFKTQSSLAAAIFRITKTYLRATASPHSPSVRHTVILVTTRVMVAKAAPRATNLIKDGEPFPLLRLPSEIVVEIFSFFLYQGNPLRMGQTPGGIIPPTAKEFEKAKKTNRPTTPWFAHPSHPIFRIRTDEVYSNAVRALFQRNVLQIMKFRKGVARNHDSFLWPYARRAALWPVR